MIKFVNSLILLMVITLSPCNSFAEKQTTFTIGIVPQFEIRHLRKIWSPIINELEKSTGYKLELKGSPTIPDFEKELNSGKFDFVYMNPYHMIIAEKSQGYIPLVRDIGRKLHGILVVRKDGNIKTLHDLNGKKIAFPAPNALGASLLIRSNLRNQYKIDFNPVYVKTHSSVYLNVIVKQTEAGGGVQKTLNQQKSNIKGDLRILHRSPEVAPHPIAVHPRVPNHVSDKIKNSLLELGDHSVGQALLSKIPIKLIGTANMVDYLPLKNMGLDKFYVEE